eukprot:TRINITY_DN772_c0_g1_i3.p1 TRINITY_DN772_c0_g1~~TRINITY_DN772_c0_g1_i3.p1  ORF type:complete len:293 (+),score=43.25 TRINITY_DN772_c0_g1_i3:529-1407(+)
MVLRDKESLQETHMRQGHSRRHLNPMILLQELLARTRKQYQPREIQTKGKEDDANEDTSAVDFAEQRGPDEPYELSKDTLQMSVDPDWMRRLVLMTITKRVNVRYCSKCLMIKPPRCHHCRLCNRCILKMDHHCPWVANCIGFYNYKYFMNMLLYGSLILIFITCSYSECVVDMLFDLEKETELSFLVLCTFCLVFTLGTIVTFFGVYHFWLVFNGKTTIDYCEKKVHFNKYDVGAWRNFKIVFGENPLTWFFPLSPNYQGEGLKFDETPEPSTESLVVNQAKQQRKLECFV